MRKYKCNCKAARLCDKPRLNFVINKPNVYTLLGNVHVL